MLLNRGATAVLIKGGHAPPAQQADVVVDVLFTRSHTRAFTSKRLKARHTLGPAGWHGTGCTLSAAITAGLARGLSLDDAIEQAIAYVHTAIVRAPGLGAGHGPLHHLHPFDPA